MSRYTLAEKFQLATSYYKDKITRKLSLSDPKAWMPMLWNLYGMGKTESGVDVNEETAKNLSSVYAAINIISKDISTLPIHLYKKQTNGKRKVINDHPSLQVLKYRANPLIPAINFRECTTAHVLAWGNCYAEIVRNSINQVQDLWPLTPDRVKPEFKNGTVIYWVKVDANEVPIPRENVLHIAGLGYNGLTGYSVIHKAAESIGLSMGAEKFGARYFGANTNMGGAIKFPRAMGDKAQANIKKSLQNYTGSDASHRWMILEQGMEIEKLGFSPDESQFLQTRQFQVSEIARWFNLPPHKLKDLTRSTFSNIEEQETEYVISCLVPWLTKIEQNYDIQLLTEKEHRLGYYFKHNVKGLLRGSSDKRADYYTKRFFLGSLSPNDIRALEDEDPIDNENADKYYLQMNLMPLDDADKAMDQPEPANNPPGEQPVEVIEAEPENKNLEWARGRFKLLEYRNITARDKISKRYYPLIEQAAGAVAWREKIMVSKLLKNKNSSRDNADNLKKDINQLYNSFGSYVFKKMGPVFHAMGDSIFNQALLEIGESVDEIPLEIKQEIDRYTDVYSKRYVGSSSGQLVSIIDDVSDELLVAIETRLDEWEDKRPIKVANNESVRLSSFVAQTAFFTYGYKSYWRIRGPETCPYCRALSGKAIKSDQSFFEGGEEFEPKNAKNGPMLIRGTVKHPPLHQGCDCYISVR